MLFTYASLINAMSIKNVINPIIYNKYKLNKKKHTNILENLEYDKAKFQLSPLKRISERNVMGMTSVCVSCSVMSDSL